MAFGIPRLSVVGDGFCVPYPVELIVKKKHRGFFNVKFKVLDVQGNLFLQVDGSDCNFQQKRIFRDPAGFPILTMHQKSFIKYQHWTVHQGESLEPVDLLFSGKQSYSFQTKTRMEVFLRSNFCDKFPDFKIAECNSSRYSYKVCRGETVIAEVNHNFTCSSWKGKEDFSVKVYPGVDYAFIAALLVIHSQNVMNWCHMYV